MDKIIKKVQQDYIAAKLRDDELELRNIRWDMHEGDYLITLDAVSCYRIPCEKLHIKLPEAAHSSVLGNLVKNDEGYRPAKYVGVLDGGLALFKADDLSVIASAKKAKIFTDIKGGTCRIRSEKTAIKFYDADEKFVGVLLPIRQQPGKTYEL